MKYSAIIVAAQILSSAAAFNLAKRDVSASLGFPILHPPEKLVYVSAPLSNEHPRIFATNNS
jgi:hypothetical protein